jgi:hypothetical protein
VMKHRLTCFVLNRRDGQAGLGPAVRQRQLGEGRRHGSKWAANAVSRRHQQLAEVGTEHATQLEGRDQHRVGEQLMLD